MQVGYPQVVFGILAFVCLVLIIVTAVMKRLRRTVWKTTYGKVVRPGTMLSVACFWLGCMTLAEVEFEADGDYLPMMIGTFLVPFALLLILSMFVEFVIHINRRSYTKTDIEAMMDNDVNILTRKLSKKMSKYEAQQEAIAQVNKKYAKKLKNVNSK
jgi:hypothetical protein